MSAKLWRINPRAQAVSLTDQFTRDITALDARNEVAADLYFGNETPNTSGAFSVNIALSVAFSSQALVGPPPGVLPTEWFRRDDVLRVVLAEMNFRDQTGSGASASAVTATEYLANWAYKDDENSREYKARIASVPRYNRAIDRKTLRGRFTSTIGSLELNNADGALDYLLDKACDGSEIRFYIGDAGNVAEGRLPWLRSQFIFMFSAYVVGVSAPSWDKISIALKDTSLLLDKTIGGDVTIGGTGPNAQKFRPLNFGYIRQFEAILQDAATLTYVINRDGNNLTIVDVRDKGVSVGYTNNGDGTISLLASPAGKITVDFYVTAGTAGVLSPGLMSTALSTRISDAMDVLVGSEAGLIAQGKYAGASPNFERQYTNDYPIGISVPASTKVTDVLEDVCNSGNVYYAARRDGYFTYGWVRPEALEWFLAGNYPSLSISDTIKKGDIASIRLTHGDPQAYEVQGYGNANLTQQQDLATSLSATQRALYEREGVYPASYLGGEPTATAYLGPDRVSGDHVGLFLGGAPQDYHLTLKRALGQRTLISCVDDADAQSMLSAWASVRRSQPLPNLEFVDITTEDLSLFQLELGNVIEFFFPDVIDPASGITRSDDRFGLNGKHAQVVSIDLQLTENRIALGLAWRRPAFTQEYV